MSTTPLPIQDIVDVTVLLSPAAIAAPFPNQGAIVGTTVASTGGPTHANRMVQITAAGFPTNMLNLGYLTTSPEYIAAQLYFGQTPPPGFLWLGLQDLTSIKTMTVGAGGTGWALGDTFLITQGGASLGYGVVTAEAAGVVTGVAVIPLQDGTGYSIAAGLATTAVAPSAGVGLTVNITAIGETPLVALQNCRAFNQQVGGANVPMWYGYYSTTAVDADAEAMALFAQSATPFMKFYYSTATATIPTTSTTDVASFMKTSEYLRVEMLYSTTQGGFAPNNIYAGAASMGMEMGLNTGLPSSWFVKFGRQLVGVIPEPVSQNQFNYIVGKNCNIYTYFGPFPIFTTGVMSSGIATSVVLFDDILVYQIQYNIMNDIVENGAYSITDPGEQRAIHQVNLACQFIAGMGALSPGTWEGASFVPPVKLVPGQYLDAGYTVQAYPIAQLSEAAIDAKELQPIICAILATEAAISISVGVYVQQGSV